MMKRAGKLCIISICFFFTFINSASAGKYSPVTFTIIIDKLVFSPQAVIKVLLFNESEKRKADESAECVVTYDPKTKKEITACPHGVLDTKAQPETFSFPLKDIENEIVVSSNNVRPGEIYQLNISGKSSDNCNTTSATITGRLHSPQMQLRDFNWRQTQMACPGMVEQEQDKEKVQQQDKERSILRRWPPGPFEDKAGGEDPASDFGRPLRGSEWDFVPGNKGDLKTIYSNPYDRPPIK